jgi:hypothetical protein
MNDQLMQRRTALKQLAIIGTGAILMPSCFRNKKMDSLGLVHINIHTEQEALLADITETIIPKTDTLGAKELGLHFFVLKMIDDCSDKATQDSFMKGLDEMETYSNQKSGNIFAKNNEAGRISILVTIASDTNASKDLKDFVYKTRRLTIQGFTSSKYVMTELLPYQMIPGHFYGCVKQSDKTKKINHG